MNPLSYGSTPIFNILLLPFFWALDSSRTLVESLSAKTVFGWKRSYIIYALLWNATIWNPESKNNKNLKQHRKLDSILPQHFMSKMFSNWHSKLYYLDILALWNQNLGSAFGTVDSVVTNNQTSRVRTQSSAILIQYLQFNIVTICRKNEI